MEFFKLKFHAQNFRIIHSAYILMHFDAFRCILIYFNLIKCYKNHFFDKFVHKKIAQFILQTFNTFWCMLMHFDAHWCILMHFRICIKMHAEWIVQSFLVQKMIKKVVFISFKCSEWVNMCQNASKCMQNKLWKCFVHKIIIKVLLLH